MCTEFVPKLVGPIGRFAAVQHFSGDFQPSAELFGGRKRHKRHKFDEFVAAKRIAGQTDGRFAAKFGGRAAGSAARRPRNCGAQQFAAFGAPGIKVYVAAGQSFDGHVVARESAPRTVAGSSLRGHHEQLRQ